MIIGAAEWIVLLLTLLAGAGCLALIVWVVRNLKASSEQRRLQELEARVRDLERQHIK